MRTRGEAVVWPSSLLPLLLPLLLGALLRPPSPHASCNAFVSMAAPRKAPLSLPRTPNEPTTGVRGQGSSGGTGSSATRQHTMQSPALYDPPPSPGGLASGYTAVLVVPTGIGAAIGGYAGDALPVARALASVVDTLVTHPNVMNGAMLSAPQKDLLYVEGYALDEFCRGRWGLAPLAYGGHRIGLLLDCGIDESLKLRHIQAANAARATLGINVAFVVETEEPVGVGLEVSKSGASWGTVSNTETLLKGARRLVSEGGCTAIAVVANFPDDEDDEAAQEMFQAYREGDGVDAVGGAEAIISHLITQALRVPCAHAPACPPFEADASVSARSSAEELGYTFLPCVLSNLHRAPALVTPSSPPPPSSTTTSSSSSSSSSSSPSFSSSLSREAVTPHSLMATTALWVDAVDVVIAPASAFGGAGVLSLLGRSRAGGGKVLAVAVQENKTVMEASAPALGLAGKDDYISVGSYLEAIGLVAAHKAGVLPACLVASPSSACSSPSSSGSKGSEGISGNTSGTEGEGGSDPLAIRRLD